MNIIDLLHMRFICPKCGSTAWVDDYPTIGRYTKHCERCKYTWGGKDDKKHFYVSVEYFEAHLNGIQEMYRSR